MTYALILAGGRGLRLYPLSRRKKPKQFLDMIEGKSLLYNTISRVSKIISSDRIYIVTNKEFVDNVVLESMNFIDKSNIIIEPYDKETAVCIALASVKLLKKDKDANILIFPSDHYIKECDNFYEVIDCAINISNRKRYIVTIGIKPTMPNMGYGYIKIGEKLNYNCNLDIYRVANFNIYNSMIKIYKTIDDKNQDFFVNSIYSELDAISIDFGVMQKTRRAYVIEGLFEWDDIGSFTSLKKFLYLYDTNFVMGNVLCEKSKNCIIFGNDNLTITFGVKDLIVVNSDNISNILSDNDNFDKFI